MVYFMHLSVCVFNKRKYTIHYSSEERITDKTDMVHCGVKLKEC